jgi:hypothetical protein
VGAADIASVCAELNAILQNEGRKKSLYALATRFARGTQGADDLIQTACEKLLGGDRQWNREEYPHLLDQLGSIMSSTSDHQRNSADARRTKLHDGPDDEERVRDARGDAETRNVEEAAERRIEQRLDRWIKALRKDRVDDPESLQLLDCFEKGIRKAARQREDTGWSIEDVRRVRRRLFRRADVVMRTVPDDSGAYPAQEVS